MIGNQCLVVDNGSCFIKAGFSGDEVPKTTISSILGVPKKPGTLLKNLYIGEDAEVRGYSLNLTYPIKRGKILDWETIEELWNYCFFNEMGINPKEHDILLTELAKEPKEGKEKMTEIFFEKFAIQSFCLSPPSLLSLLAAGKTLGIVLDSGDGTTQATPIYEGELVRESILNIDLAGIDVSELLSKKFVQDGHRFIHSLGIVRSIKQTNCYISLDYENELKNSHKKNTYKLEDGNELTLDNEAFMFPETLFQPKLFGNESMGLHELLFQSILKCDICVRRFYYENIVLAGGNTMLPGFKERISKEISLLAPAAFKTNVVAPIERNFSAWLGGSIVSSLDTFKSLSMSKKEYDEFGPSFVNKKFI